MSLDIWLTGPETVEVEHCDMNITHNVTGMWSLAGVYDALYNSQGKLARDILETLQIGIAHMERAPDAYIALEPENKWGTYQQALRWLKEFTAHCSAHPEAKIGVSK